MKLRPVLDTISAALRDDVDLDSLLSRTVAGLQDAGCAGTVRLLHDGDAAEAGLLALPTAVAGRASGGQLDPTVPAHLPAEALQVVGALGLPERGAVALAPLVSERRALGALLLVRGADLPFTEPELWWVGEIAARLAQSVAAAALRTELGTLHTLIEHLPSGVVLSDPVGRLRVINASAWSIFRASPAPVLQMEDWQKVMAYHADGRRLALDEWPLARTLRTGEPVREEIRITGGDGTVRTLRIHTAPIRAPSGEITAGASVFDDVTEQAAARGALRQREQQLRMVADALPVLISLVGRDRRYRFANQAYREMWGVDEVIGKTVDELLGPGAQTTRPHLDAAFAGRPAHYQAVFETNGAARTMEVDYVPRFDEAGEVDSVVVLSRDVTEARRAEDRIAFLAEASRLFTSYHDVDENLRALGPLAVPRFSDWLVFERLDPTGASTAYTVHHADPAMVAAARQMLERWPTPPDEPLGPDAWPRQGTGEEPLCFGVHDEAHLAAMRGLGIRSAIRVAIPTSRGPFGILCLATAESRRRFTSADAALASEVAARLGLWIDNARLVEELKEADRNKEEFIAMLAHELRNPMAPILTGIQLLQSIDEATARPPGPPSGATARTLASLERQTTKLARLVDDLLDVSRINRGRIHLSPERCDVAAIVRGAVETVGPVVQARRHELTVHIPEGMRVHADPVRLEQVFANLIDNAAKYTRPGGAITVEATRLDAAGEPSQVAVAVTDTGDGIPREVLPHVFQLFHQGNVGLDRAQGGLGLGLTLVDRLVRLHGGTVTADSAGPGRGSTFVVTLPLVSVEAPASPRSPPEVAAGPRRSVLVVDDNVDAAIATAELLERLGHQVHAVHEGWSCLAAVSRRAPEVVLLDIGLPGMDGFEVARRLRADGFRGRIVAVTGYGRTQDRVASAAAGCDEHLVKPVGAAALLRAIGGAD